MRLKKNVVTRNLTKHQPKTGQKSLLYTLFYGKKGYLTGTSHNILQQWTYASHKKTVADSADPVSTSYTEVVDKFSLRSQNL